MFYETIHDLPTSEDRGQVLMSSHSPFVITELWNEGNRDFIYQCNPVDGTARLVKFADALEGTGALRAAQSFRFGWGEAMESAHRR